MLDQTDRHCGIHSSLTSSSLSVLQLADAEHFCGNSYFISVVDDIVSYSPTSPSVFLHLFRFDILVWLANTCQLHHNPTQLSQLRSAILLSPSDHTHDIASRSTNRTLATLCCFPWHKPSPASVRYLCYAFLEHNSVMVSCYCLWYWTHWACPENVY